MPQRRTYNGETVQSALMAIGALFGVEIFRRNSEHVVTLDAYPVQNRLPRLRRLVFGGLGLRLGRFGAHGGILS